MILINGASVVIPSRMLGLMVLVFIIARTVGDMSKTQACPDCGCDIDDHDGDFCRNCGEHCEIDE